MRLFCDMDTNEALLLDSIFYLLCEWSILNLNQINFHWRWKKNEWLWRIYKLLRCKVSIYSSLIGECLPSPTCFLQWAILIGPSPKRKNWVLPKIEIPLKDGVPFLWPMYTSEKRTTVGKTYCIKSVGVIGNILV